MLYVVLCVVVVLVAVIFSLYSISKSKYQVTLIKIKEADENIEILLRDKYQLLNQINDLMKKKKKEKDFLVLDELNVEGLDSFELNKELSKYDKKIIEIVDYEKDLKFSDKDIEIFDRYNDVNIQSLATEKYYNDNVAIYNSMVKSFPSNIVAKLKKYKNKKEYSNEKEEIFEILKD